MVVSTAGLGCDVRQEGDVLDVGALCFACIVGCRSVCMFVCTFVYMFV